MIPSRGLLVPFLAGLVIIAIGVSDRAKGDWSRDDMNRQIDQTNFVVNSGCSGTLIDLAQRYILTAKHCVTAQYETIEREKISDEGVVTKEKVRRLKPGTVKQIAFHGSSEVRETTYRTKLIAVDGDKDLALIQVIGKLPNTAASPIACQNPKRGDPVFIVGNPMGALYSSVTSGMISSVQRDYGIIGVGDKPDEALLQVSGGIIGGNSGGAVYNTNGDLIGVPVLGHRINEVIGFAVPVYAIKAFLKASKIEGVLAHCEVAG